MKLFGQFVDSLDPADDLFEYAVTQLARLVGLRLNPAGVPSWFRCTF